MRFSVVNLGCKVNRVESDACAAVLLARGLEQCAHDADLVLVNTCTVTGEAEKKARKAVRRALRENPRAQVVVTGCAAALRPDVFEAMGPRVSVVPKASLEDEVAKLSEKVVSGDSRMSHDAHADESCRPTSVGATSMSPQTRARVGIKIQDGCDNACTFCIVHVARGRAWSKPAAEVLSEAAGLIDAGVKEIVLTGINLGSYRTSPPAVGGRGGGCGELASGELASGERGLAWLLRELTALADRRGPAGEPPCRFRVSSIEPCDVDDGVIDVLAASEGRVCRHLHLPLQAGSTKVLREMTRPYAALDFERLVDRLHERVPSISLSTDVIAGFPGETDADFRETVRLCERCGFSKMHVFPYSRREGTPAAARGDQVPAAEIRRRADELIALGDELRARDLARRAGTTELVLVERRGRGTSESYHELAVPCKHAPGLLVPMTLPIS